MLFQHSQLIFDFEFFFFQFISKDLVPGNCTDYTFGYNDCPKCIQAELYV